MDRLARVEQHFLESIALKEQVRSLLCMPAAAAAETIVSSLIADHKILACGNGGSAADAQHFVAELVGRFERERPGLGAISLATDPSVVTAIANDYDYGQIFAKQVRALGRMGDVLVAISTSGNSGNVIEAIEAAHEQGMPVIAFTGRQGGRIGEMLRSQDVHLNVPAERTARIQEVHILLIHAICDLIDGILLDE